MPRVCVCLSVLYIHERERGATVAPYQKPSNKTKKKRRSSSNSSSTRGDYLSNTKSNWLSEGNVTKKEAVSLFSAAIERVFYYLETLSRRNASFFSLSTGV